MDRISPPRVRRAIRSLASLFVSFTAGSIRGVERRTPGEVDYRLARQHLISEYRKGRLAQHEVCDAHPELMRAARECAQPSREDCPICEAHKLVLVSYVFGPTQLRTVHHLSEGVEGALQAQWRILLLCGRGLSELQLEPSGPHVPAEPRSIGLIR